MLLFPALLRFLVQSGVRFCATLHRQVSGECGRQSTSVCLQGSGLHPGTRVTQVSLQWRVGQVSVDRIKVCVSVYIYICVYVLVCLNKSSHVSVNQSVRLFWLDSCVWLLWAQCSYSTCSPASLLSGQLAQVLLWPPHQHPKPTLPHKDIRGVSSSVPGGQTPTPTPPTAPPWPLSRGNSGFVQEADPWCPLGRLSADQSKTPPYASPSPLQSHTLQLYPRVRELMAFSARGERWFHWAFKRKVHGCHAS